jgi:hypothetical protein
MATVKFTDIEIADLLKERKQLPSRWERRLLELRVISELSQKRSRRLVVKGQSGSFEIRVRQSTANHLDFSVVIGYRRQNETGLFLLRRYNGRHPGPHVNRLPDGKRETIAGFHIHTATEEAQRSGRDEEALAVSTSAYSDVFSAIDFALTDCNFDKPVAEPETSPGQMDLFSPNG